MKTKRKIDAKEISAYDNTEASELIITSKPLRLGEIGVNLPATPPTQVVSIRLPTGNNTQDFDMIV